MRALRMFLGCLSFAGFACMAAHSPAQEKAPTYKGKSAREWGSVLKEGDPLKTDEAGRALAALGPRAAEAQQ